MMNEIYKNSFKEVYDILENTEKELVDKIPKKFMDFLKSNMNKDYKTDIKKDEKISNQKLLSETEAILTLIYKSYWATDEEKKKLAIKEKKELLEKENNREEYIKKDIYETFEKRKNTNKNNENSLENNLIVIEKESFIKKILNKIKNFLKK